MADIRIPAPASGNLGHSPASFNSNILPRWAYLALALACAGMGAWASIVTLRYFEHGAAALETDPAMQALAVGAALLFVASEMAAFALAALLTERQLKARRWGLTAFAVAVLLLEVFTIVAVQLALTVGADMTQSTVQTQEKDLRARIAVLEAGAAAKLATAEKQRATARDAYELRLSAKSSEAATAEQAKTAALYDELKAVQSQKRPTLTGLLGEKYALAYAVARGILISVAGLVFFGVAGALLRAARGGTLSVDAQLLALLHELRGIHAAPTAPAQIVAPVAPAPALPSFKPVAAVAPTGAPVGVSYGGKMMLAGGGALAAMAAPVAHSAPAVPAAAPVNVDISKPVNVDIPAPANAGLSSSANGDVLPSPEPVNVDISSPVNVDTPDAPKKARKARVVRDGAVMDSGLSEHDGARYRRALAGVKSGKFRPSIAGLAAGVEASAPVARRYLAAMAEAGVIAPSGRGYALVRKGGTA